MTSADRLRTFIVCPGLGHVQRGFETLAQETFDALQDHPRLNLTLVKGAGPTGDGIRTAFVLKRDGWTARSLSEPLRRDPFVLEQWSFALGLAPLLTRAQPQVILLSEWTLAKALDRIRRAARLRFRMVLSNGAAGWPPFPPVEHVQQLTPAALEVSLKAGEQPERHTLLPLGLRMDAQPPLPSAEGRRALRRRLGLPQATPLLLSVAALNNQQKRLNYVIDEVASLPDPRPHLVMLGQREAETPAVLQRACERLGQDGFTARTVPSDEVPDYYLAAHAFVLGSTTEGMGRVLQEALSFGLPVLAHRYPITDFVLGPHGFTADLRRPGELAALITRLGPDELEESRRRERHRWTYDKFSWEVLAPRYVELLTRVAGT